MPRISLVEVSPRDGLQNERVTFDTQRKLELIEKAVQSGACRVEATSFVSPKRLPQMADAEALMAQVPRAGDVAYAGLALNARGAERAAKAGCDEINFVLVASDTFNIRNQGVTTRESLKAWREVAAIAKEASIARSVTIGAAFGCPFEGSVPPQRVLELIADLVAGDPPPDEIALADTIGVAVPVQVEHLFTQARELAGGIALRGHFHDTRNTGIANAYAAARCGATALDGSLGGIGGCPFAPAATGNVATEDLIYLLEHSGFDTGMTLEAAIDAARWLSVQLGKETPGMLSRAGPFPGAEHRVSA